MKLVELDKMPTEVGTRFIIAGRGRDGTPVTASYKIEPEGVYWIYSDATIYAFPHAELQAMFKNKGSCVADWEINTGICWSRHNPEDTIQWDVDSYYRYNPVPKTITIGDVTITRPETQTPKLGKVCYLTSTDNLKKAHSFIWAGTEIQLKWLALGTIHLCNEAAVAHTKALITVSGGTYGC